MKEYLEVSGLQKTVLENLSAVVLSPQRLNKLWKQDTQRFAKQYSEMVNGLTSMMTLVISNLSMLKSSNSNSKKT